jgi:large subunit ribosomal protein L13
VRTFTPTPEDVERKWFVVDASGRTLGRLATRLAVVLRGKDKPTFTPSMDMGSFVVVTNAEKIAVTGRKMEQKIYYHHTQYPGGLRSVTLRDQLQRHPERVLLAAVKGMLPKNQMGKRMLKKLKVYAGGSHPHEAQKPQPLQL